MTKENSPETVYEFVSGFCKTNNSQRLMECAYRKYPDGSTKLDSMDCDFKKCTHNSECILMKAALENEK